MQEKTRIFKSSRCYTRFLIHFFIRKKWPILCLRILVLQSKKVVLIRSTPSNIRCIADQSMTNLRCTTDHHAVPPLNIRPVESGIIPTIFNRLKNLSRSPRPLRAGPTKPLCILDQHTLSPIKARSFFQSGRERGLIGSLVWTGLKLHSHQTADQPPTNADKFLWLGLVWSGKKLPALIEERIYPRSTPAVSALYPWCTHAQIPLFPTYPRPSGWPIPALHDQPPTYSWCNYAHYA